MQNLIPTLKTERLTLRPIALDDFDKFARIPGDAALRGDGWTL